ncbi:MAG: TIGR02270 family protein [Geobacteraceae bacterium]|nr:TIGR02270 family protein [Geobacteraceae bacterium]
MENKKPDFDRIAITGIGLTTSVGLSAPTSLAAIRGVIANFSEHETVLVNGDEYGTELSGAKIARLPEQSVSRHILGDDRAIALLAPALRECTDGLSADLLRSINCRISCRIELGFENFENILKEKLHDLPIPALHRHDASALALGRCLFFEDIIQATTELRSGSCQMVLVGCVDSLCETSVLDKLCEADRLKSGTNPEGIIAGEAAGVILLELESCARSRKAAIHAYISAWGQGVEPHPFTGMTRSRGKGLSSAYREAFAQLPEKGEEIDMVIADLNGEHARAYEWGLTEGRIFPTYEKMRELKHPADCVGDCGAAMGSILLATAVGFMSEVIPPLSIAIFTSDDGGARRVLCLEKGDDCDKNAAFRNEPKKNTIAIPTIIAQHNDELSFLWLHRNRLIKAPYCGLFDLARHDRRIEAHLDGLRLAGETGWEMCKEALLSNHPEDFFAATVLAYESGNKDCIQDVMAAVQHDQYKAQVLISALGWIRHEQAGPRIKEFLTSESPFYRFIGIAASAIHRRDPGHHLDKAVCDDFPLLRSRGLRAYGELGRSFDLNSNILRGGLSDDDAGICFSTAWSAALTGNAEAVEVLKRFVVPKSAYGEKALNLALRRMEQSTAVTWQQQLAQSPDMIRFAVTGSGIIGDPSLVPWLTEQMKTPALARVAGEAFTMITGVDIASAELRGTRPDGFNAGPNDDPNDSNVDLDADDNLPWPNDIAIAQWWDRNKGAFPVGTRHLIGKPIAADQLWHVLRTGRQRQRCAASLELAIIEPGRPLFEVRAPGFRQLEALRLKAEGKKDNCLKELDTP